MPAGSIGLTLASERSACFDGDAVRQPVRLRKVQPGDRICPHGMIGSKRLVRLYQDRGIPSDRRRGMLVVEDGERIIWAVGVTTCNQTRVTPQTHHVLKLTLEPSPDEPIAGKDRKLDDRIAS